LPADDEDNHYQAEHRCGGQEKNIPTFFYHFSSRHRKSTRPFSYKTTGREKPGSVFLPGLFIGIVFAIFLQKPDQRDTEMPVERTCKDGKQLIRVVTA